MGTLLRGTICPGPEQPDLRPGRLCPYRGAEVGNPQGRIRHAMSSGSRPQARRAVVVTSRHGLAHPAKWSVQLLVERVDVLQDALEVRIRSEGLASLAGELRQ
jgi:hypothetical protein